MKWTLRLLAASLMLTRASGITVDGTRDAGYGPALAVQTVNTGFGDASPPGNLGGSELDAAYATISNGRLYVMLTGNHEPNVNKLDVFIDSKAGGENTLTGTPQYDYTANGTLWISQNLNGLTFDPDFQADYHLFTRWSGGAAAGPYVADFIDRQGGNAAQVPGSKGATSTPVGFIASGTILAGNIGTNVVGTALSQDLDFAINDNNTSGVIGGTGAADTNAALAVTTGIEFSIALADLGNPPAGGVIRICAIVNNSNHDYLSNQSLGGLPVGTGNLGGPMSVINFNNYAGLQYFSVANSSTSSATVILGAAKLTDATVQITVNATVDQTYPIQVSTNLVNWSVLTNVTVTGAVGQFTDSTATGSSHRYYRAVVP